MYALKLFISNQTKAAHTTILHENWQDCKPINDTHYLVCECESVLGSDYFPKHSGQPA